MSRILGKPCLAVISIISFLSLTACTGSGAVPPSANDGDGGAAGSGTKTVSLSVMTSDRFLELAKQKFEESHPDINIDIKEYAAAPDTGMKGPNTTIITKPDPKNTEKYVSTVGTELMSGKASDIIVMNGLPYKKYADKKLLENISDLMSRDKSFQQSDYYTDILDAMKYKGALYTVPIRFGLNKWLGNQALLANETIDDANWTWQDFKSLASKWLTDRNNDGKPDVYPLGYIEPNALIAMMLGANYAKFVDDAGKKAKFDSPEFIQMLKLAKSMYDEKIIPADNTDNNNVVFNPKSNIMMAMDMYSMPKMFFDGKAAYYNPPSENDGRGASFTTNMPVSINSKSANKKEAWEFVKFLLTDDMQSVRELNGFPVNRNGAKAQAESLKTLGTGEGGGGKGMRLNVNGKELALQPAADQDIAAIMNALDNVKQYAESDLKISDIVSSETGPFFQGQKTAEEAAKTIQNKVSIYLQE
ncbi:Putative ABC transporter substrate-binding protein YesO [Paenibacillus konkukensis]|uniref:ABC transporter substrate-binding protein YesO n=1 Tax=Paenibacillus konkukensis TaxID=2020716 RepID=A0ABY4RLP5_9BACL|nr:extracellular solute-binding protein [Paenibacillus konkukensis]UQZ82982.1 Putative ABC transporter substrate-binding protein YesO [Paenibacillus konkukensis]